MPGDGVGAGFEELGAVAVVGAAEDEVDFGVALGSTRGRVDVVTAKVAAKFKSFIDGEACKVLVTECCIIDLLGCRSSRPYGWVCVTYRQLYVGQRTRQVGLCLRL